MSVKELKAAVPSAEGAARCDLRIDHWPWLCGMTGKKAAAGERHRLMISCCGLGRTQWRPQARGEGDQGCWNASYLNSNASLFRMCPSCRCCIFGCCDHNSSIFIEIALFLLFLLLGDTISLSWISIPSNRFEIEYHTETEVAFPCT